MAKVIGFLIWCSAWTLLSFLIAVTIGNRGLGQMMFQEETTPTMWWSLPLTGLIAGAFLATANLIGPWPRIAWWKVAAPYGLVFGAPLIVISAYLRLSGPAYTFMYISPDENAVVVLAIAVLTICAIMVLIRYRKHLKVQASSSCHKSVRT